MKKIGMEKGEAIEHKWVTKAIGNAQKKVEGHNFDIRKHLLAIAEALVALADDAKLRDQIGKANRAKARAQFDADRMIATYRRLYSSAMHGFDL